MQFFLEKKKENVSTNKYFTLNERMLDIAVFTSTSKIAEAKICHVVMT